MTVFQLRVLRLRNAIYFSIIAMPKKFYLFSLCYFRDTKLCANHEKTQNTKHTKFHLYCWDHVCKVNEWCLIDCFHREFGISTQIMVRDYSITKCKKFSACGAISMALWAIVFAIQKNYVNSNPEFIKFA